jgi:PAS domain S-box-containing protein
MTVLDLDTEQELEERFRATFEQAAVGMAHMSTRGEWLRVNQRLCEMLGWDREELTRKSLQDITYPPDRETDRGSLDALLRGELKTFTHEKRYLRRDGSLTWASLTVSLVRADGQPAYFIGVAIDVNDRKAAEEAVKKNESRFRALVENAHDLILVIGPDGEIAWVTDNVSNVLGYKPAELCGHQTFAFVHPDDIQRDVEMIQKLVADGPGASARRTVRVRGSDGRYRWLDASFVNMLDAPGVAGIVINSRDVTEQRRLQHDLEQLRRVESLGRVAANTTHEFNNVLLGIDLAVAGLLRNAGLDEKTEKTMQSVRGAVARGRRVTSEILRYAQTPAMTVSTFPVAQWIHDLAPELQALASQHRIEIVCDEALPVVRGDREHIAQATINLVVNARDAMAEAGTIRIAVQHDEQSAGGVVISVSDTGTGIPPEQLETIFEPMFTTKKSGTGLGLSIVQMIVARHHGSLSVQSTVGEGTTFRVCLPGA